jgi:hypothetical protein
MRLRFNRRIRINFGRRGAHYTVDRHGARATIGLPGSGLYLTEEAPSGNGGPLFVVVIIVFALLVLLLGVLG